MRPRTVAKRITIEDIAPEITLTGAQRAALISFGDSKEDQRSKNLGRNAFALLEKGYIRRVRGDFEMTTLGEIRYRAELSHQRHCDGCSMCRSLRCARPL